MTEMSSSRLNSNFNTYYLEVSLEDGVWCDAIKIPEGDINHIVYVVSTEDDAMSSHVQVSLSADDTDAIWIDFVTGEINPAVNLFRARVDGGAGTLQIRCQ